MARFGAFELDQGRRQLFGHGRELHLTPKAFDLLALLCEAAPRVVTKAELHRRLWPHGVVSDATLVGLVKELRRALAAVDSDASLIRTAHRVGYALDAIVERDAGERRAPALSRSLIIDRRRIVLFEGEYVIGRDSGAHIRLDFATVSRRHALLVVRAECTTLEDLGSKNGTMIDGTRVTRAVLRDGDRFSCGQITLTYRESSLAMPTATHVS